MRSISSSTDLISFRAAAGIRSRTVGLFLSPERSVVAVPTNRITAAPASHAWNDFKGCSFLSGETPAYSANRHALSLTSAARAMRTDSVAWPRLFLSRRRQNVFPFRRSFHPPDDGGEVFLNPGLGFRGIDYGGRFGRRHRKANLCRRSQNQSEVLAHEANRKLRRVVVGFGGPPVSGIGRSDDL